MQDEDYDVEEEYDNDYAENYFDNGEGDDVEDLGGGADEGGGGKYVVFNYDKCLTSFQVLTMIDTVDTGSVVRMSMEVIMYSISEMTWKSHTSVSIINSAFYAFLGHSLCRAAHRFQS